MAPRKWHLVNRLTKEGALENYRSVALVVNLERYGHSWVKDRFLSNRSTSIDRPLYVFRNAHGEKLTRNWAINADHGSNQHRMDSNACGD
jgi:hypothetical protein